jgi:hypothetical protein
MTVNENQTTASKEDVKAKLDAMSVEERQALLMRVFSQVAGELETDES